MQEEAESGRRTNLWKCVDDENKEDPPLTHSIGALIGGTHRQMLYYDRLSIIVSQEIDIEDDPDPLIAMLIGLHRLTLEKHGIHSIEHRDNTATLFEGRKLTLKKADGNPVALTLGKIIFRQPGIIGRDTCFVEATAEDCGEWKGMETIVKISWQAKSRPSEKDFMDDVKNAVDELPKDGTSHQWVFDHLPNILLSQDFEMAEDSPQARLKAYFDTASYADGDSFEYEERVCRIMVQEKLYSITSLREPRQYTQGIFDILQIHRWVYDHARIIHRDISMMNLMWRRRNGVIYGVLNDFDLSSYCDYKSASALRRTTRPYYACDLLKTDPPVHISSSSFYLPFESWYDMTYPELYDKTYNFFIDSTKNPDTLLPVSVSFSNFQSWLTLCFGLISADFFAENAYHRSKPQSLFTQFLSSRPSGSVGTPLKEFDNATLGGFVDYSAFFQVMCKFADQDLVVKYDPDGEPTQHQS
ncbi:uncharacterized protein EV420DRAFT_1634605 [Desarmillaria tabescens]|uniref:Fungal-type protein kinase domain-containing protein n=1 Tax=Armillaria tabescens TaxID=1929756 RepID=A0AA39NQX8_ARMTA|nr:uncharacterized protein EV420DRAFT_1634605 [Desarmillaria tabescens]KAK0470191.1 hypothetical protein EV420DRAFT_1634605 [Desarmillaria tabescens]